jgi:hypothetical protein
MSCFAGALAVVEAGEGSVALLQAIRGAGKALLFYAPRCGKAPSCGSIASHMLPAGSPA